MCCVSECYRAFDELMSAYHVSNRPPGEDDSANELADELETAVLVRNSHDDADWDEEDGSSGKGEK